MSVIRGTELICVVEQDQIWACGTVARKTDRVIQHRLRYVCENVAVIRLRVTFTMQTGRAVEGMLS